MPRPALSLHSRVLRVIVPFCAGYFLSYLLRTVNAVISPELTREMHLSAADLGLLTSTYFFSFGLAQIPVGIALDRFGARRVAGYLMLLTAAGAFLFSVGESLVVLACARSLIGIGVSACLMAGLMGFLDWFAPRFQPSLTGVIMASGAIGALSTSIPVNLALPLIGWRGVFVVTGVLAVLVSLLVFRAVPESAPRGGGGLRASLAGLAEIYRAPRFWRFAPQGAMFTGGFMALQGLWVVPWLMNVNGYSRDIAAQHLFAMSLGMLAGQLGIAALLARAQSALITPYNVMRVGLGLMMVSELAIIFNVGSSMMNWAIWSMAAAAGSQMYGVVAREFDPALAGRASTAINLAAFVGAFSLQWGLGAAIDGLRAAGHNTGSAYFMSFAAMLVVQLLAYGWMLRRGATSVQPQAASA